MGARPVRLQAQDAGEAIDGAVQVATTAARLGEVVQGIGPIWSSLGGGEQLGEGAGVIIAGQEDEARLVVGFGAQGVDLDGAARGGDGVVETVASAIGSGQPPLIFRLTWIETGGGFEGIGSGQSGAGHGV